MFLLVKLHIDMGIVGRLP